MVNKRIIYKISVCGLTAAVFYIFNFFILYELYNVSSKDIENIETVVLEEVRNLEPFYLTQNPKVIGFRKMLLNNFQNNDYESNEIKITLSQWKNYKDGIYNIKDPNLGKVMKFLKTEKILNATNAIKGTQLKLLLHLNTNQKVLFKPQWYSRDLVIEGPVYAGKDRHNAEIYAFYLASVLNISWIPPVVGRKINLKEINQKADSTLKKTMFIRNINSTRQYCLYGKCYYCKKEEHVCGDENNLIEGAIVLMIPGNFKKERSPWQRTYKKNVKAIWENNKNYCRDLKSKISNERLLDLVDASIFDFLIQNGDRHHYETLNEKLILLDNGKGFGNPDKIFFDILAPLYQCCIIRSTTWENLKLISGGTMTKLVDAICSNDELENLITENHKKALERRLLLVFATVKFCVAKFGKSEVFIR